MKKQPRSARSRIRAVSWRDLLVVVAPIALASLVAVWVAVRIVRPAPPDHIQFVSGPDGSNYRTLAERYKAILERYGIRVDVLASRGGLDNVRRLADEKDHADVGFVQAGLTKGIDATGLVSLGSVFPQPLMVYYRNPKVIEILSEFRGKRLAIGPEGSGTRALALDLLNANGIDRTTATLSDESGMEAADALIEGKIDAAFLTSDTASREVMRKIRAHTDIELMNFRQAAGYVRKFRYLTKLSLPEGVFDLERNEPPAAYQLIGPTVELVARDDLHPAISDLLISAAREIHGEPGLFRDANQYPSPEAHELPISEDAERYYKSGGQFLYKRLPFWFASLIDRVLVLVVPLLVIIVPTTRLAPAIYRWRVRSRIYKWYGALMAIEREMMHKPNKAERDDLLARLDAIEDAVNEIKTPLSFADQLYVLREHVSLVRHRLESGHQHRAHAPTGTSS